MRKYIVENDWQIIEDGFDPNLHQSSESIFSIGNGKMGQRANFEEKYSGKSLRGSYIAGVYYPDKTRVGWWKNGYPEYFAKVLNAANWIGIDIRIDGEELDLATCEVKNFRRVLDMKNSTLHRSFTAICTSGKEVEVNTSRFISMVADEVGVIKYSITPINFSAKITLTPYIDGDVVNKDSNYDEKFWDEVNRNIDGKYAFLTLKTKKLDFFVCTAFTAELYQNDTLLNSAPRTINKEKYVGFEYVVEAQKDQEITLVKYCANLSSQNYDRDELLSQSKKTIIAAERKGFDTLHEEHSAAWEKIWETSDIKIHGDVAAQQGIRFNILQLYHTYTGQDPRLNIGPKGFTGEKYGGSTYWDTEAYCLPFYLSTADPKVARQLLQYRYKQLDKAIENATKLGFTNGAALFPMVTMNGEECHNEWEITFEEIHRNGAIAYAIYNYINYTVDEGYLAEGGLEVLLGISRFWAQRVNWSVQKEKYVMLGVTGPNEYENNVNNNWYTNYIAAWCMEYTTKAVAIVKKHHTAAYKKIVAKTSFDEKAETEKWEHIINNIYLPFDEKHQVFLQQEGFMDKEQITAAELDPNQRPINQHWSWDRILRSIFIKQADTLQGFYFFEDDFDIDSHRRHFDFYEPRTLHESSLSPCVHVVLAAKLGKEEKAYELYLRTSRLDLDDYNHEVHEGLHITSMAGTWLSVVQGFGGMRVKNGQLHFSPMLPKNWSGFEFKILFRGNTLNIAVDKQHVTINSLQGKELTLHLFGKDHTLPANGEVKVALSGLAVS